MLRRLLQRITKPFRRRHTPEPQTAVPPETLPPRSSPKPPTVALNALSPTAVPARDMWPPDLTFVAATATTVVWECDCGHTFTQTRGFPRSAYLDLHRPDHRRT